MYDKFGVLNFEVVCTNGCFEVHSPVSKWLRVSEFIIQLNFNQFTTLILILWIENFGIIWKLNKGGKKSKKKKSRHDGGHAGEHHATKEKMRARKSEHEHRRLAKAVFPIYRADRNETPVPENQNLEAKPGG